MTQPPGAGKPVGANEGDATLPESESSKRRGLAASVGRDTILYGVGHVLARSTYLILVPLLTRAIAPAELGSVDLLTAAAAIGISIASLEINQALARFISSEPDPMIRRTLASSALWYSVLAFGLLGGTVALLAEPIASLILGSQSAASVVRAAGLYAALSGIFLVVQGQLRWELRAAAFAGTGVLLAFGSLAAIAMMLLVLHAGPAGVFLGQGIGTVIALAAAIWLARRSFGLDWSPEAIRTLLSFSLPLVPATIAAFVTANVDRFVISRALGNSDVAVYGVGVRIASVVGLALIAFQMAIIPLIYARYLEHSTPRELISVFKRFVALAACAWLGISLFAPEIVGALATDTYAASANVVPLLAGSLLVTGLSNFAPGLVIARRTGVIAGLSITTMVLATTLNVLLVPVFGIGGAGIAALASATVGCAATIALAGRHYAIAYPWWRVIATVLLVVVSLLIGRLAGAGDLMSLALRMALWAGVAAVLGLAMFRPRVILRGRCA